MASRTRNRLLWIAALVGVVAGTVLVVLVSHSGNRTRVTPLREEKTSAKPHSGREGSGADTGSLVTPAPRSAGAVSNGAAALDRSGGAAPIGDRRHEGIHLVQSANAGEPRRRAVPPGPAVIPAAPPVSAQKDAAPVVTPAPSRKSETEAPHVSPAPGPRDEPDEADIEIRNGRISKAPDHVNTQGKDVTLGVRSDELTIVEIEDVEQRLTILPGKEVPITVDSHLAKHLEVKLMRRAGVLVLRLDD